MSIEFGVIISRIYPGCLLYTFIHFMIHDGPGSSGSDNCFATLTSMACMSMRRN
jgi:hypothetical protein